MINSTTSRSTGVDSVASAGSSNVVLSEPTDVRLGVAREDIASMTQVGDNLVIEMLNGDVLTIENFFAEGVVGAVESQIFLEGAVSPLTLTAPTSGLVAAGGGLLGGVGGVALGVGAAAVLAAGLGGSESLSPAELALDLINAFDGLDATMAPSVADYIAAGVEGVTEGNLAALNDVVAGSDGADLSAGDIEAMIAAIAADVASDLINGYDGTDATTAPTAEDYADAGVDVSGVTEEQIAALNEVVAASGDEDLTPEELQAMVDEIVASDLINGYDGTDATTAPTAEDYADAGVTGVSDEALDAVNEAIAASGNDAMTAEDIQAIVDGLADVASDLINGYDGTDATTAPTAEDYAVAGVDVSGVTEEQIAALNEAVAASGDEDLTPEELQAMVDEIVASDLINGYDGTGDAPTADDYTTAGVDMVDVTDEQLAALNEAVAAAADEDLTAEELQDMIDAIVGVDVIVEAATNTDPDTDATVENFVDANVTGVDEANIDAINSYIAGLPEGAIDSTEELQAIVDAINAAEAESMAEALAEINALTGDPSELEGLGELLEVAGIDETIVSDELLDQQGLTGDVDAAILAAIASTDEDLTLEELQALVDEAVAEVLLDGNIPLQSAAATAEALEGLGIEGVTLQNQDEVQDALTAALEANPNLVDSPEELQAVVDTVIAGVEDALEIIENFQTTGGDSQVPTEEDYANAGIEGVTEFTITEMNAIVSELPEGTEVTAQLLQTLSDISQSGLVAITNFDANPDTVEAISIGEDGTITLEIDRDGDGVIDNVVVTTVNEDGSIASISEYCGSDTTVMAETSYAYTYNANGTVAYSERFDEGELAERVEYTYNADGFVVDSDTYQDLDGDGAVDDLLYDRTNVAWDEQGRPLEANTRDTSLPEGEIATTYYSYNDETGATTSTVDRMGDGLSNVQALSGRNDEEYITTLDSDGRGETTTTNRFDADGNRYINRFRQDVRDDYGNNTETTFERYNDDELPDLDYSDLTIRTFDDCGTLLEQTITQRYYADESTIESRIVTSTTVYDPVTGGRVSLNRVDERFEIDGTLSSRIGYFTPYDAEGKSLDGTGFSQYFHADGATVSRSETWDITRVDGVQDSRTQLREDFAEDGTTVTREQWRSTDYDATEGGREEFYQSSVLDAGLTRQTIVTNDREYITDLDGNEITIQWSDYDRADVGLTAYGLADATTGEPQVKELLKVGDLTFRDSGTTQNLEITQEMADFVNSFDGNDSTFRVFNLADEAINLSSTADVLNDLIGDNDIRLDVFNWGHADATFDLTGVALTTDGTTVSRFSRTLQRYELADADDMVDGVDVIYIDQSYNLLADVTVVV